MQIIDLGTVTDAALTSNVLETPPTAYNAGTTYADGDTASVFSGVDNTTATIYESLVDSNTGNTPASSPDEWLEVSTAYLAWNSGTAYSVGATVTYANRIYEAIQAGTNKQPDTEATYWLDTGPSNKWAMFDNQIDTQTTHGDKIVVSIDASGRFDTLALFNLAASAVNITVMNGATELHNVDYSLVNYAGIANYWDHFFNPVTRRTTLLVTGLPIITGLTITVTITGTSGVAVGHLAYGRSNEIGGTQYGATLGFLDFSKYENDDFGRRQVVTRGYKKSGDFDVFVERAYVDSTYTMITARRGTPTLIIASDQYDTMVYFGLILTAKIVVSYPLHSILRLQIEDF